MKDLEQLEKQNKESSKGRIQALGTPIRKKNFNIPPSSGSEKKPVNYEDKIKELEAKLFGQWTYFLFFNLYFVVSMNM